MTAPNPRHKDSDIGNELVSLLGEYEAGIELDDLLDLLHTSRSMLIDAPARIRATTILLRTLNYGLTRHLEHLGGLAIKRKK
jgi:hypothetical protein